MALSSDDFLKINEDLLKVVDLAIRAELLYQKQTSSGRKLGITGEIGEILVCNELKLKLAKHPRSEGYDAIDKEGLRVQIKSRRSETGDLPAPGGRLGSFSKHDFDYALMVLLNQSYQLVEVWKADAKGILPYIAKNKRANPTIRQFRKCASQVLLKPSPGTRRR